MTGLPAWRAFWLALGDPFRMGWYALGAATVLALPVIIPDFDSIRGRYPILIWFGQILGYWVFAAPGALRLVDEPGEAFFQWFRLFMLAVTALMLFLIELTLRHLFDSLAWGGRVAAETFAYYGMVMVMFFVKENCMLRAARDREIGSPLAGIMVIARRPALLLAYGALYFAAVVTSPIEGIWIGHFLTANWPMHYVTMVSAAISIYFLLALTALVSRGVFTRPAIGDLIKAFD